jgi:hypothetical protein
MDCHCLNLGDQHGSGEITGANINDGEKEGSG